MKWKLTCAVEREGDWYVSFCDDLNIASQGRTIEEAKNNLEEAIEMFFEDASPSEVMSALSNLEPEDAVEVQRQADIPSYTRSQDTRWELSVAWNTPKIRTPSLQDTRRSWFQGDKTDGQPYTDAGKDRNGTGMDYDYRARSQSQ